MTEREAPAMSELRRLLDGASPAPWQWLDGDDAEDTPNELQDGRGEAVAFHFRDDLEFPDIPGSRPALTDGRLCAALRNNAEALLAVVEAAREFSVLPLHENFDLPDHYAAQQKLRASLAALAGATE